MNFALCTHRSFAASGALSPWSFPVHQISFHQGRPSVVGLWILQLAWGSDIVFVGSATGQGFTTAVLAEAKGEGSRSRACIRR
ncbi:hypothetical protein BOTBODRAFT_29610 [Botryobasidium botryosum FD-172 SS1]|uniref:Uncharacterized protein n=1 Tax=Botryobasidium botryosum (strain FD-172 SS1) TaxID=930990 RepID=A0A067MRP7_BOTB1|nr:hypothetical protein BOTBODRAFT_29610 [Botryobasidium botryosum FD-172 SS1]